MEIYGKCTEQFFEKKKNKKKNNKQKPKAQIGKSFLLIVCVRSVLMPLFVCFLMKKPSSFCCFALEAILIVEMNTASITDTDWMFQQQ